MFKTTFDGIQVLDAFGTRAARLASVDCPDYPCAMISADRRSFVKLAVPVRHDVRPVRHLGERPMTERGEYLAPAPSRLALKRRGPGRRLCFFSGWLRSGSACPALVAHRERLRA
jgi:hypothetical protein